jgi:hypothetical protein
MRLDLVRKWPTEKSTVGELYIDGTFECYTLEDVDRLSRGQAKIPHKTAVPTGSYEVRLTHSPRFGRILPLLVDVPGFEGVRIHPGNTPEDTDGCILPGRLRGPDSVAESRSAFDALYEKLAEAEAAGRKVEILIQS